MSDDPFRDPDGPADQPRESVLSPQTPPEHGPDFWANLERSVAAEPASAAAGSGNVTTQLPGVGARLDESTRPRSWAVLGLAATALVLVGVAFMALRSGDNGASVTTDLAVDAPNDSAGALDGSDDAGSDRTPVDAAAPDAPQRPTPVATAGAATPQLRPPTPPIVRALGADDELIYLARDGAVTVDARFLATWEERRLSWYSIPDTTKVCADPAYAEISYVNESGITQAVHDPQLRFSGDISHFVVDPGERRAAWLVSCGTQLEFFVADLGADGEIEDLTLVWFGEGEPDKVSVVWQGQVAGITLVGVAGAPVYVDFDTRTELASGTGVNPAPSEPGSPPGRSSIPLAASGDALFSYWSAPARSFADGASAGADGCDTHALWVRQPGPWWTVALAGELELRSIDAVALSTDASRIAFADSSCDGRDGRLFVGVPGGDGLIRDVKSVDLSPYVPGFADRLFWIDPSTLRIETDNRSHGVDRVRFDYRLGDGTEPGILLQLD